MALRVTQYKQGFIVGSVANACSMVEGRACGMGCMEGWMCGRSRDGHPVREVVL